MDFSSMVTVWPMPNTQSEARVVAVGSGGMGVSVLSSSFVYPCNVQLASQGQLFTSSGGNGSVQVTTTSKCGWGLATSDPWIQVTSTTRSGSGALAYSVAPNTTSTARSATITVAGVNYVVTQGGSASGGTSETLYLSDLPWKSMANGWGPVERDKSNGESATNDGRSITLNGRAYTKGLGVHSDSSVTYVLNGTCSTFQAEIGVDDEVGTNGSVVFEVWGDGSLLADSDVMTGSSSTVALTTLVAGVRELQLRVTNGGNDPDFDHADWANARINCSLSLPPTPPPPDSTTRYLSDIPWTSESNGWGPVELDKSNGEQKAGDGRQITLNGRTYTKGLGTHAPSAILYPLGGTCSVFQAEVGVDDEVGTTGSVVFQVWADGTKLFDSGAMTGATATRLVNVNISGKAELILTVTNGGDNRNHDHADWANARITCTAPDSPPPPSSTAHYLSDLPWASMTNGWGPVERDRSNSEAGATDGDTITLNGQLYAKGLGGHADSSVSYAVNGMCSTFQAEVGVDDEVGSNGSIVFEVWADATKLYDSGVMNGATATKTVNVNIANRNTLSLVITDGGDNPDYDHGDWANARVTCSETITTGGTQ